MDYMTLEDPFGADLQTSVSGGHAVEKVWATLRLRRRFWFFLAVALIITGALVIFGFIMIRHSPLSWTVTKVDEVQNISLWDVNGIAVQNISLWNDNGVAVQNVSFRIDDGVAVQNISLRNEDVAATQNVALRNEHGIGLQQVCNTSDCVHAANHLLLGMNETANPCDDFYQYACGNWAKFSMDQGLKYNDNYKQIQASETALVKGFLLRQPDSIKFQPAKPAAIVYRQCINGSEVDTLDNIKTVIELTAKLGGWPSLEGHYWNKHAFDLATTLALIFREYLPEIFFGVTLAPHGVNETVYIIKLTVPTLTSEDQLGSKSYSTAFKTYYASTICEVIGNNSRWASLIQDADELIKLEEDLRRAARTVPQQQSNATSTQEIFTLEEFKKYFDKSLEHSEVYSGRATISWKGLLNKIFGTLGVQINDNQVLNVTNPAYFIRLAKILDATPKRIIANYLFYSLAFNQLQLASEKIYQLATQFFSQTSLPFQSREDYCFSKTMAGFAIPVMHEYLKTKSNLEDRAVLEKIAGNFRATFDERLQRNTWLTDATKLAVRKKLGALKFFIGYPNWLLNATEIETRFKELPMRSNSIEMFANAIKTDRAMGWQKLGNNPRDFDELWFRWTRLVDGLTLFNKYEIHLPSDVIPYYITNSVALPMGFIQPHQFYSNVPSYLTYSRAGFVLGHEIVHGFDAGRRDLDENGQKDKSWSAEDVLKYEEHSKCYKDQYNKFELFPGMHLNGYFGLDENIADNDGLKLAYLTYKEQLNARGGGIHHQSLPGFETLSTEQMFFLSYSSMWCQYANEESQRRWLRIDPHSPRKFRVNGVLQNLPEFAHAWNCPTDAPMNPFNKCKLW